MRLLGKIKKSCWLLVCIGVAACCTVALFAPWPVEGCYTFGDLSTVGHNFLHLQGGDVSLVLEYGPTQHLGTYKYQEGVGWIWRDAQSGREILLKPHALWIRFVQTDTRPRPPKLPFELRDINLVKTRAILRQKSQDKSE